MGPCFPSSGGGIAGGWGPIFDSTAGGGAGGGVGTLFAGTAGGCLRKADFALKNLEPGGGGGGGGGRANAGTHVDEEDAAVEALARFGLEPSSSEAVVSAWPSAAAPPAAAAAAAAGASRERAAQHVSRPFA